MNVLHGNYALLLLQLRGKCCYRHFVDSDIVWLLHSVPPYPKTICFFLSVSVWLWVILLCSHSVQSLSCVWLFATPWTAACQASLSITNSWSPRKPMSIESVMPSNYLILCHPPSPPAFNLSQHQGLFQWVSSSHQVAKVLEYMHYRGYLFPTTLNCLVFPE